MIVGLSSFNYPLSTKLRSAVQVSAVNTLIDGYIASEPLEVGRSGWLGAMISKKTSMD
jgi:hypothetical protein